MSNSLVTVVECSVHGAGDKVLHSFVGMLEMEYRMVSKTIALRVRVQIPLPTPPLNKSKIQLLYHMTKVSGSLIVCFSHNKHLNWRSVNFE